MYRFWGLIILAVCGLVLIEVGAVISQDQPDLAGWGKDSEYNK